MTGRYTDKTILVTGGTGGLGRAVTQAFLEEGADVIVTYRKQEEFDALKNPPKLEGYATDVTDEEAVRHLVENIIARHSRLDAVVNTVGGYSGGNKFWEADPKIFDQMLALNLRSGYTHQNWSVTGFAENLLNKKYFSNAYDNAFITGMFVEPSYRSFGLRLTVRSN